MEALLVKKKKKKEYGGTYQPNIYLFIYFNVTKYLIFNSFIRLIFYRFKLELVIDPFLCSNMREDKNFFVETHSINIIVVISRKIFFQRRCLASATLPGKIHLCAILEVFLSNSDHCIYKPFFYIVSYCSVILLVSLFCRTFPRLLFCGHVLIVYNLWFDLVVCKSYILIRIAFSDYFAKNGGNVFWLISHYLRKLS